MSPARPWIVESKLDPPVAPPDALARALLPVDRPLPAVVMLSAGPGYGKSLALASLALTGLPAGGVVVWLALDELDADPATFFHYVLAGLRRHIPDFGAELEALLGGGQAEPKVLWRCFFGLVAGYNLPALRLVLDDVHHWATAPELGQALGALADKLPRGCVVLAASRQGPPFPLARLTARGLVLALGPAELRFTADQAQRLLAARAPEGAVPAAWQRAAAEVDGWPQGLDLITRAPAGADLGPYLAEEVLDALAPPVRAFALQAALVPEVEAAACPWSDPAAARGAIAELVARHMLLPREGERYRFPSYLQAFLAAEAARVLGPAELARTRRAIATALVEQGRPEQALPHMVAGEAWEEAMAACRAAFPPMRFDGRQAQIQHYLAAFPASFRAASPWWWFWHGRLAAHAGRHDEAEAHYARACTLFEAAGDRAGAFKALVCRLSLACIREQGERFATLLDQARARYADGLAVDRADFALIRALDRERQGDLAGVRAHNEEALRHPAGDLELSSIHALAHMNLFTLALQQGDLARADEHVGQLAKVAAWHGLHALGLAATFLQAHLDLLRGRADEAARALAGLPGMWRELLHWHDLGVGQVVWGQLHMHGGAWAQAEAALRKAREVFAGAGFPEGVKLVAEHQLWLAVGRGEAERADARALGAAEPAEGNVYDVAMWVPHARALHLRGRAVEAAELLDAVLARLEQLGAHLLQARALLYLAAARSRAGDAVRAGQALAEARGRMDRDGLGFLAGHDQLLWAELGALAATAPLLDLHCFGRFEARIGGVLVDQWPRRKAKIALAALAMHPAGLTLAELGEILLGEEEGHGGNQAHVTLMALRRSLEPGLGARAASRYVGIVDGRYVLAREALAGVDVLDFDRAWAAALGEEEPAAAAAAYEAALVAYRGDLCGDPVFKGRFEVEREQRRRQAVAAVTWLAAHAERRRETARAIAWLDRGLAIAPGDEPLHLAKIEALLAAGRPDRARQAYWDCRRAVHLALGETPSAEFEAEAARRFAAHAPAPAGIGKR